MQARIPPPPPPPPFHAVPPPAKQKGSPWVSCAIGCGVMAAILAAVVVGLFVWLMFPSPRTIELTRLIGPDAAAVVHLPDASEDVGIGAVLSKLQLLQRRMQVEALRGDGSGRGDQVADWLLQLQEMNRMMPGKIPQVLLALEPGADERDDPVVVLGVSLDTLPKLVTIPIRLVLKGVEAEQGSKAVYRDVTYTSADVQLLMTRGVFLLTTRPRAIEAAIDRILDGGAPPPLLAEARDGLAERWDLYALGSNQSGDLTRWIDELLTSSDQYSFLATLPWDDAEAIEGGLDIVDGDRVRAELRVRCTGPDGARAWADRCRALLASVDESNPVDGVALEVEAQIDGVETVVSMDLAGLDRLLEAAYEATLEAGEAQVDQGEPY